MWIFLRGLVREQRHWGPFLEQFADEMGVPRAEILCLDLPGIGTERARAYPPSVRATMEDLRARAGLGPHRKAHVFSMSLGSMCALEWAAAYPEELEGVVVINTSASNLSPWYRRLSLVAAQAFMKIAWASDPWEREKSILRLTSNLRSHDTDLAREWSDFALSKEELMHLALRQLLSAAKFRAPSSLQTPALVLSSAADRLLDPSCSTTLARRLGLENHVHLTAGHDLPLDDPQWVIRQTRRWVQELQRLS